MSKESYEDDLTRQLLADSGDEVEAIKEEQELEDDKSSQQKRQIQNSNSIGDGLFGGMSKLKKIKNGVEDSSSQQSKESLPQFSAENRKQ